MSATVKVSLVRTGGSVHGPKDGTSAVIGWSADPGKLRVNDSCLPSGDHTGPLSMPNDGST